MISFYHLNLVSHLLFVSLWTGAILFFLFVLGPAAHTLQPAAGMTALNEGRKRFQRISAVMIVAVLATGILNVALGAGLAADPAYGWILSAKLFLFIAMVVHHALQALKHAPELARLTARASNGNVWPEPLLSCWKKWFLLLKINATLAPIIFFLGVALAMR